MKKRPIHGRPIYLEGGEAGVLLLHGVTGTPQCMRYLAQSLQEYKFTVSAPMLAGHGTSVQHFEKTTWEDWYRSAESAFQELKAHCRTVLVAGLSLGGLLTAHLAHHHPRTIAAIGLMATPMWLDGFMVKNVFPAVWKTPLKHLYKYHPKSAPSIRDPSARRRYQAYEKIPLVNVATFIEFQSLVRDELKHIRQPTMVMHSLHDQTVPYGNLDYIKAVLASREIKTVTLKKSNHIITVDYEKEIVAKQLGKFFKKYRK
ncbi:MAG: alpha/beta fold hydrolase [Nitrospirales bacterium]|nr:alpha/beta fold hydrolase [Nitrospirales bacterium]